MPDILVESDVDQAEGADTETDSISLSSIVSSVVDQVMGVVWGLFRNLFTGLYIVPLALVGIVGWVFLGEDRALKQTVEGFPGLADLPVFVANILVGAVEPVASSILTSIAGINLTLVTSVTGGSSILAVPLLFVLQTVELGVLVYALWAGAQMASAVPVVGPALEASGAVVTKPFRVVIGVIR